MEAVLKTTGDFIKAVKECSSEEELIIILNSITSARIFGRICERVKELGIPYDSKIVELLNSRRNSNLPIW